ncbi:MAG: 5-methyltetrahydropteroyltriglutamate--homocysteine S-methyltransferase, partial [Acidimicrobiales bacterium]
PAGRSRTAALADRPYPSRAPYGERKAAQQARLGLPPLPTTTIGSFPQTPAVRQARSALAAGRIDRAAYEAEMRAEIERVIDLQVAIGLDVLVHGEPERNDMVRYFGENMGGFAFTRQGWVCSFGTRYVRPPIIYGDVSRSEPMTLQWALYAASLTDKPVKGMLTGPVTMLRWSFVRDDLSLSDVATQLALAISDEVADLDSAGTAIIQVDEPGLREGLPLRSSGREEYLSWAVYAFRLATAPARGETQVHTHMCYAEFGDIMGAIEAMDADVISLEAARSSMAVAKELGDAGYSRQVGPGVYDIHSPRVPSVDEVEHLIDLASSLLDPGNLWVNPDCGLKTRRYAEVTPALENMVEAARRARRSIG